MISSNNTNDMSSIYNRIANLRSNLNNNFLVSQAAPPLLLSGPSAAFGSSGFQANNSMALSSSGALNQSSLQQMYGGAG